MVTRYLANTSARPRQEGAVFPPSSSIWEIFAQSSGLNLTKWKFPKLSNCGARTWPLESLLPRYPAYALFYLNLVAFKKKKIYSQKSLRHIEILLELYWNFKSTIALMTSSSFDNFSLKNFNKSSQMRVSLKPLFTEGPAFHLMWREKNGFPLRKNILKFYWNHIEIFNSAPTS